jgi:hypothetical protein
MNTTTTSPLALLGTPTTIVVVVLDEQGEQLIRPIYECHSWDRVADFVEFHQTIELKHTAEIQVWEYSKHLATFFVNKK